MKQILQSLKDGSTQLADVPSPRMAAGQLLIRTSTTLVSAGTERMLVEFGKANWLAATVDAVQSKLDQPLALGYCNVDGCAVGDRVVSNGKHADAALPRGTPMGSNRFTSQPPRSAWFWRPK